MPVEFENDEHHKSILYAKLLQPADEAPSIIGWLKRTGLAKSDEGANKILICVMVFSLCLTTVTIYKSFFASGRNLTPSQEKALIEPLRIPHTKK